MKRKIRYSELNEALKGVPIAPITISSRKEVETRVILFDDISTILTRWSKTEDQKGTFNGNTTEINVEVNMREKEKEKPEFDITDRGYNVKAWDLKNTETEKGDALIEVRKNGVIIKEFIFPAYKIWNIAAHFRDIVDSEEAKNIDGYRIAASTGL